MCLFLVRHFSLGKLDTCVGGGSGAAEVISGSEQNLSLETFQTAAFGNSEVSFEAQVTVL